MDTKYGIVQAAFCLFIKKGFTDVSVNEIIAEAGVTKGGFYHHFKSKDELITSVFDTYICSYFNNAFSSVEEKDMTARERLDSFYEQLTHYDDYINSQVNGDAVDFNQFYLLIMEGIKKYNYIFDFRKLFHSRALSLISEALDENKALGLIDIDADTQSMALSILAYNEGAIHLKIMDADIQLKDIVKKSFMMRWDNAPA